MYCSIHKVDVVFDWLFLKEWGDIERLSFHEIELSLRSPIDASPCAL